jgi:lambda family phage tail tape measure protein
LTVAQLRLDLANKQLLYIEQEGKLKIDALTTDRYTIQLQESGLAFAREKAQIENQRLQALNKENLTEQQRNIIDIDSQAALALATEKHIQNSKRIVAEREREIKLIQAQVEVAQRMEGFEEKRLDLEQNRVYMTDYAYKVALEELNTKQKVAELEQQIVDARTRLGAGAVFEAEKARIEDLIRSEQSLSRIRKDGLELEEYRRKSFKEGWEDAFRKFAQDSENYGKLGSDMFNSAISNMNSAIDNFVKTGKLNFKSFAQSVIQDILSMMLRFQAMQLVMAGMRSFGFAGAMPTGTVTVGPLGLPLPGKASGGFIDGPAIVGENGPELFIPSKSGTIIPNGRVSQALSQGPSVVYNGPYIANMSAIDTQSGVAFLARNKQAVWAANQSAQRSLPVSK